MKTTEPTTEELIKTLRFDGNSWAAPLFNLAADRLATLTAAKEAAEKETAALKHELDATVCEAEKQCKDIRRATIKECAVAAMSPAQGQRLPPLYRLAQKESAAAILALIQE